MREPGAGGGEDDLNRQYEIQFQDHGEMIELIELIGEVKSGGLRVLY